MSEAIVNATEVGQVSFQYDHVALFAQVDGEPSVIEASPKYGVVVTPWTDFLAAATLVNGQPGIVVMRLKPEILTDMTSVLARARTYLGQSYDWSYLPDNDKLYCSELIYECYRQGNGEPIFIATPMSFRDAEGQMPAFWVELFAKLGETVPEGVPGTNPNDLSRDEQLVEVHRYF